MARAEALAGSARGYMTGDVRRVTRRSPPTRPARNRSNDHAGSNWSTASAHDGPARAADQRAPGRASSDRAPPPRTTPATVARRWCHRAHRPHARAQRPARMAVARPRASPGARGVPGRIGRAPRPRFHRRRGARNVREARARARSADRVAEELAALDLPIPDLEVGRVVSGDAALVPLDDRPQVEAAWEQARLLARIEGVASTHTAVLKSPEGDVQMLALAAMARRTLVARVLLARRGRAWRTDEVREIEGLGARLALALQARALQARTEALYRRSDHVARTLQQSLLPAVIPDVPSCQLAVRFAPAGEGDLVGGDFYDVFAVGDEHWAIVIGDVCGKGAHAAAVTAMARSTLRSFAGSPRPPADVLRSLNEAMLRQGVDGRFITVAYALISARGGEAHLTVACAGHPPAIFVSEDGEPARLDAHGIAGIRPQAQAGAGRVAAGAGREARAPYTDGVTDEEPPSSRHWSTRFGNDRRAERRGAGRRATSGGRPVESVRRDDVAIVALRYLPPGYRTRRPRTDRAP